MISEVGRNTVNNRLVFIFSVILERSTVEGVGHGHTRMEDTERALGNYLRVKNKHVTGTCFSIFPYYCLTIIRPVNK